jgi:hypothetical protein
MNTSKPWTGHKSRKKLKPDATALLHEQARELRAERRAPARAAAYDRLRATYQRLALRASPDSALRLIRLSDNANTFR